MKSSEFNVCYVLKNKLMHLQYGFFSTSCDTLPCFHVMLSLFSCNGLPIFMLCSLCFHVMLSLFSCYTLPVFMLCSPCFHVMLSLFSCNALPVFMLYSPCFHVMLSLFSCLSLFPVFSPRKSVISHTCSI